MKTLAHPAVLFSLYLALLGGSYLPYFAFLPLRISYHIIATGVLIWWLWRDGLPSTPLLIPLAVLAATSFVSAINAIDSRIALESWWHWLVNGLLGLMLIQWMRKGWAEKLMRAHFGIAGVVAVVCLLQIALMPGVRVNGIFGLINLTGAYAAALLLPIFVWAGVERRVGLLLVGFGLVAVLLLNDSRGPLISITVAGIVFLLLRYHVQLPVIGISGVIVLMLAFGVMQKSQADNHASGDGLRVEVWRSALQMLTSRPLTGVGPGLFGQAYREIGTIADDRMSGAHDWYLNLLAEVGLPGAGAAVATGLVFLHSLPRKRNSKQDAILAALAGVAVHLLFDNYPSANFVFLINLYIAYLMVGKERKGGVQTRAALKALATSLLMIFTLFLGVWDYAQIHFEDSLRSGQSLDAKIAAQLDPANRLYQIQVARLTGDEGRMEELDPTLSDKTRLDVYGIINFGRAWW